VNIEKKIISIAQRTLQIEAETLSNLKNQIGDQFVESVKAIFNSNGRVIVSGIGKTAIIAQKIVATLNSTGTPAIFMHAADAIHGDLGIIQSNDIVLCISKSGETSEIKVLVPLLRNIKIPLIAMVCNEQSFLAKNANYLIYIPVPQEADPNNLAPTASTTAQLAIGDAIATALLAIRGFSPRDFALFHPGGTLGKQLYLRVHDLYPNNECPSVHTEADIRSTIIEMTSKRLGTTAVVDQDGKLKGIITDGDLRRMLEKEADMTKLKAKDIMTPNPQTIASETLAINALEVLRKNSITQLLVVKNDTYVGVIHLHDLAREGLI
jgi:arabinose-5-phosphate isomerase